MGDPHTFDEWKDRLAWPQWVWGCSAVHVLSVEVGARKRGCSKGRASLSVPGTPGGKARSPGSLKLVCGNHISLDLICDDCYS